jgi:hypothetical protein
VFLPFFNWLESLTISAYIRESAYGVAAVNIAHLLALVVFLGALLVVDLRLLGRGMTRMPLAQLAADARPWLVGGFFALLLTGVIQLLSTPIKEYYSPNFWLKLQLLLIALPFTIFVRGRIVNAAEGRFSPVWHKLTGLVSIGLWSWIGVNGRLIGLLS